MEANHKETTLEDSNKETLLEVSLKLLEMIMVHLVNKVTTLEDSHKETTLEVSHKVTTLEANNKETTLEVNLKETTLEASHPTMDMEHLVRTNHKIEDSRVDSQLREFSLVKTVRDQTLVTRILVPVSIQLILKFVLVVQ